MAGCTPATPAGSMHEGYLYICDRLKDMIISGGENVYPREVENVLFAHPAIADAAVIGIPDVTYGETVMAVVVLKAGADAFGRRRSSRTAGVNWAATSSRAGSSS